MHRTPLRLLVVLFSLMALTLPVRTIEAQQSLAAEIGSEATLLGTGDVLVRITISCRQDVQALEAFLYVTQEGLTSPLAGIPLRCTNRPRIYLVRVQPPEAGSFQPGQATASGYMLLYDPATGMTESVSPTQPITIR
jgi:hypothetical protein